MKYMTFMFSLFKITFELNVYESTLSLESLEGVSGLNYIPSNDEDEIQWKNNSFTICLRFNYKRVGFCFRILKLHINCVGTINLKRIVEVLFWQCTLFCQKSNFHA